MGQSTPGAAAIALTAVAMVAFAGNSLLCRLALAPHAIDPTTFALVRVAAGAVVLMLLVRRPRASAPGGAPSRAASRAASWPSALSLAVYAVAFALAYVALAASTGTLALFGAVQVTMIASALARGERPPPRTWIGFLAATAGLLVLLLPGATAPDPFALSAMLTAGVAWGVYSLRGRGAADPASATAHNFVRAVPICLLASALALPFAAVHAEPRGLWLAIALGAVTSGLGYVVWYSALRRLSATDAAMAQLTVPVLAALGGAVLLGETLPTRLWFAAALVLGGTALAVLAPRKNG